MRVELQWSHVHHEYGCTMVYGQDRGICSACAVAEGVSAAVVNHGSIEGRPSHGQRSPFKLSLAKRKRGMLITSPREEQDLREYRIPCKPLWSHLFQASPGGHFVRDATWIKLGHKNHSTSRWYASKTFVKLCYDFCSLNKVCCWSSGVMTVGWNLTVTPMMTRGWHVRVNNLILSEATKRSAWMMKFIQLVKIWETVDWDIKLIT